MHLPETVSWTYLLTSLEIFTGGGPCLFLFLQVSFLLTDQKSLHCHFHSESSYLIEQGLYVGPWSSHRACIFSPVPQWLPPVTLAKQSASRYAFSSTIWTQWDGVEWLWACDIYTNPRLVLPCFPFWARMQMEFAAAQAVPPTHAVMDNFQLDTH